MGRDHSPKERQRAQLARKKAGSRASFDRILIVTEGSQTEPHYFQEICQAERLPTANVVVLPGKYGTAPTQVVEYAEELFRQGDPHQGIGKRAFERVYTVFDRDTHPSYHAAIEQARRLGGQLKNDSRQSVIFRAMPSVPCFEIWLLLHFEDVSTPLTPAEALHKLRKHLPRYEKGSKKIYEQTKTRMADAIRRAQKLQSDGLRAVPDDAPFTSVWELAVLLTTLRQPR